MDWLVVDKPAGWLTIPAKTGEKNLLHWLEAQPGLGRPWVVHRIDRETSGIVLFARSEEAHRRANQWFRERQVRKDYIAIVDRPLPLPSERQSRPMPDGSAALTQLTRIAPLPGAPAGDIRGYVAARPLTGRRHQIRWHLASLGLPICGDTRYGSQVVGGDAPRRIALHARAVELPTGERFVSEPPPDFFRS